MFKEKKIGFIGGGAMAEALIRGLLTTKLVASAQITASDVSRDRLNYLAENYDIKTTTDNLETAACDILILSVKPQVIGEVLSHIKLAVKRTTTVVSIAAGITVNTLEQNLSGVPVVRVMPNTPVAVGEGMAALTLGKYATAEDEQIVSAIFSAVGKVVTVPETAMDAITGLSGSGPGYAFVIIDALADAGVAAGLSRQMSITLAAQTLLGAAKMALVTGEHPAKLRDMVTSPAGTTIAGIYALEQKGIRAALMDAVLVSTKRSKEMSHK